MRADLPALAPINKAFNIPADMTVCQRLHRAEEEYRRHMFGAAIAGTQLLERNDLFLREFQQYHLLLPFLCLGVRQSLEEGSDSDMCIQNGKCWAIV